MAKQGFTKKNIPNLVDRGYSWALCVGSGISYPVFPLWKDLARKIIHTYVPDADSSFDELSKKMSPEVLLQSAIDFAKISPDDFSSCLAKVLYEDLFQALTTKESKLVKSCLLSDPGNSVDWNGYLNIITKVSKGQSTAMTLAETVLKLKQNGRPPASILSFNAEMLLGSLMNAIANKQYGDKKKFIDYITEPISNHVQDRIPYYFCHGVMPVPGTRHAPFDKFNAADRLVFLENEYLQLANSSYSWQASAFMNTLTTHTVFFVGLSFVDPNIRRWLAWIQKEKLSALKSFGSSSCSTSHYWIEKRPKSTIQMRMIESSVSHLGIRVIWINNWREVGEVLKKGIII